MRTTPIDRAKVAMGYQTAMQRPCCRNCQHGEQASRTGAYNDVYPWRCIKGGFGTTVQAVCKEHQPARKGGAV